MAVSICPSIRPSLYIKDQSTQNSVHNRKDTYDRLAFYLISLNHFLHSGDQSNTVTKWVFSSHPHLTSSASGCLFSGLCSRLWHIATSHRSSSISSWETLLCLCQEKVGGSLDGCLSLGNCQSSAGLSAAFSKGGSLNVSSLYMTITTTCANVYFL